MAQLILLDDHLSLHAAIRDYLQRIAQHKFVSELTRGSELISAVTSPTSTILPFSLRDHRLSHCRPVHSFARWKDSGAIGNSKQRTYRTDELFGQHNHVIEVFAPLLYTGERGTSISRSGTRSVNEQALDVERAQEGDERRTDVALNKKHLEAY